MNVKNPAGYPLASDLVWTQSDVSMDDSAKDFVNNTSDVTPKLGQVTSNHINGKSAIGGNTLFMDSHAEWRSFNDMKMRYGPTYMNMQHYW